MNVIGSQDHEKKDYPNHRAVLSNLLQPITAWSVLFLGLLLTTAAWHVMNQRVRQETFENIHSTMAHLLPKIVLMSGVMVSFLTFGFLYSLVRGQKQTNLLASTMSGEIRENEERFRTLAVFSPIGIFLADAHGQCTYTNARWLDIAGITYEQSLGTGWVRAIHPDDHDEVFRKWGEMAKLGQTLHGQIRFRRPDGSVRWVETHAGPVYTDGRITGYVGTAEDVTERRQAEETLRRQARELVRSNADLEQFAYVASHDLQEPLRAVEGCAQMLESERGPALDERGRLLLAQISGGARRMRDLINDLLALSRVSTSTEPMQLTDAGQALDTACANLQLAIRENDAHIERGQLPKVMADAAQLSQVFQNLLGNALKFRSRKRPCISVTAQAQDGHWHFRVADNGIGIPEESFQRIFKIFQRLHPRQQYDGTGIGLAICKKVIERHRGTIWVESQLHRGTTFHFRLPRQTPKPNKDHSEEIAA